MPGSLPLPRFAAVILAGGRGERLGGAIKSELMVGGIRLLDRAVAVLRNASPLLVAHGPLDPELLGLPPELVGLPDLPADNAGPLAGVAAAVAHLRATESPAELLVSAAVDTPFLPADFVQQLCEGISAAPAGIASYAGQPYPTNAIWRLTAIADLPERVRNGTAPRSLKRLAEQLGAVDIGWPERPEGDPFANINTQEDLAQLRHRADLETPR